MIAHLDNLLRHLLLTGVDELTDESQVQFAPPDDTWRTHVSNLTVGGNPVNAVNIYLADIRENRTLRSNERIRDFSGPLPVDTPAPRRIDCHYLASAWSPATVTANIEPTLDEHALLYKVVAVLMNGEPIVPRRIYAPDPLPAGFPPEIADTELPSVILPLEGFPKMAEFWGTFGTIHPWRPMVYFVVTLPVILSKEILGPMVTTRVTEYRLIGASAPGEVFIQIGGAVMDGTGTPVANASVSIEDTLGTRIAAVVTATDGRFTFGGLNAGTFVLRVRAQGFNEATRTVTVPSATGNYDVQVS